MAEIRSMHNNPFETQDENLGKFQRLDGSVVWGRNLGDYSLGIQRVLFYLIENDSSKFIIQPARKIDSHIKAINNPFYIPFKQAFLNFPNKDEIRVGKYIQANKTTSYYRAIHLEEEIIIDSIRENYSGDIIGHIKPKRFPFGKQLNDITHNFFDSMMFLSVDEGNQKFEELLKKYETHAANLF